MANTSSIIGLQELTTLMDRHILPNFETWCFDHVEGKHLLDQFNVINYKPSTKVTVPVQLQYPGSFRAGSPYDKFISSVGAEYTTFNQTLRYMTGTLGLWQAAQDLGDGTLMGKIKVVKDGLTGFAKRKGMVIESYLWGDGSGIIWTATGAATGQSVPMDRALWGLVGTKVDGHDPVTGNMVANGITVASIDVGGKTIEFDPGDNVSDITDGTEFYYTGGYGKKAPLGFPIHVSDVDPPDGPYQDKSRLTNKQMRCIQTEGSTPGVPEDITFQRLLSLVLKAQYGDGGSISPEAVCSHNVYQSVIDYIKDQQIVQVGSPIAQKKAGFSYEGISIQVGTQTITFRPMIGCPENQLMFIDKSQMAVYSAKQDGGWWKPGGNMFLASPDYPLVYAIYYMWMNILNKFPQRQARMLDIKLPAKLVI